MPLTKENFENFYLGNGAEFKIISDLFLHGYEAYKPNPDIGLDILVTNKGLSRFRKKKKFSQYLQVKSTFMISNKAKFYLKKDEIDFLISDKEVSTIFCYFKPNFEPDPQSFERGDDEPWRESLEADYMESLYKNNYQSIKREGCLTYLDFKQLEMEYFWLNSKQLRRATEENIIFKKHNQDLFSMTIEEDKEGYISMITKDNYSEQVVNEIRKIYYLFNSCRGEYKLKDGDFLLSHY